MIATVADVATGRATAISHVRAQAQCRCTRRRTRA